MIFLTSMSSHDGRTRRLAPWLLIGGAALVVWLCCRMIQESSAAPRTTGHRNDGAVDAGDAMQLRTCDRATNESQGEARQGEGARVAGRVVGWDYNALRGARVVLERLAPGADGGLEVVTDDRGEFEFSVVTLGKYAIVATWEDIKGDRIEHEVTEGGSGGPLVIRLGKGGILRVCVEGPWGMGTPGVTVAVRHASGHTGFSATGTSDSGGEILMRCVPPGTYRVETLNEEVGGGDVQRSFQIVDIEDGRVSDVLLGVGCGLTGGVYDAHGEPVAGAVVRLTHVGTKNGRRQIIEARTDREGRFAVNGFGAGEYRLGVQMLGDVRCAVNVGRLIFDAGQWRRELVYLPASLLCGRVQLGAPDNSGTIDPGDRSARKMLVQAVVVTRDAAGRSVRQLEESQVAFLNEQGEYRFIGLAPGEYWLRVASPDPSYRDASQVVDFRMGGELRGIDFVLEACSVGILILKVLAPDGSAAQGVSFWCATDNDYGRVIYGEPCAPGTWRFTLAAGERHVKVGGGGFETEVVNVAIVAHSEVERNVRLKSAR